MGHNFTSSTGDGTAISTGHPSHAKVQFASQRQDLHFSVILRPWALSSAEAPSVGKRRENGENREKMGKLIPVSPARFRFPSPQLPRPLFPSLNSPAYRKLTKETSAEERGPRVLVRPGESNPRPPALAVKHSTD